MEDKIIKKMEESLTNIIDNEGLSTNNLDTVLKLSKIKHLAKEDKNMYGNYGNYNGRRPGYDTYGNYGEYGNYGREGSYGARGRDRRYRGDDYLDRMYGEYNRYEESRERYGAGKESDEAHHYMVETLKDFVKYLFETSETPQQKQELTNALQNSMR